jgi:molybdenum cofactor biosynthesis enzyme MoaA
MTWKCAAIDHGVTIFPNGKIGPCCQISATYLKPISELSTPNRFADLKTENPPEACQRCTANERNNIPSYRRMFNQSATTAPGFQFVDLRNTNLCNLKCRYCGPHFSSQWADELGTDLLYQEIDSYKDILITDSLHWMYFTGGEPLIIAEHWNLLQTLVDNNQAKNISLLYNTNLTTIKYKDLDIVNLWEKFKSVTINCSIDAVGPPLEFIRSGSNWTKIKNNLEKIIKLNLNSIKIILTPVISILNIWFIVDLFEYAKQNNLSTAPIVLTGPDYLALNVVPDELKDLARQKLKKIQAYIDENLYKQLHQMIEVNDNQGLFNHTVSHVLLLDKMRNEKLFDILPFDQVAKNIILKNHEYQ